MLNTHYTNRHRLGFTLVEGIVAIGLFMLVSVGILQIFDRLVGIVRASSEKITASNLANEQLEIARNLPFADVGIVSGIPVGKIPRTQNITRDNKTFVVTSTVRNVDDTFDGTIGGNPNDLSPADYKLVQVDIACTNCENNTALNVTTTVAPKNLETASSNGALFVRVFDASGQPIQGAAVHLENNAANPPAVIDELTNANGELQLVDVPPGSEVYEISVTKSGYSTDQTLPPGAPQNPNPSKPHASVALQQVTQISFSIDRVSTLNVSTVTETCTAVGNIEFSMQGAKVIGTEPDVYKYTANHSTDASGNLMLSDLEWDTYALTFTDTTHDLQGAVPTLPISINPDTTENLQITMRPKNPNSILIAVEDAVTLLPLTDASVKLERSGTPQTRITGRGFLRQTDWSGGDGQEQFTDQTKYFSADPAVDTASFPGEIRLRETGGAHAADGALVSSTFDTGSPSNFHNLVWQPQSQAPETGTDSIRFQIATNNDNATWDFVGPDGTASTFYTLSDTVINDIHDNHRYFRYKLFISTADIAFTPIISDISFTFTSSCVPPGQVLFDGLAADTYTLTVTRAEYQTLTDTVAVGTGWQQFTVNLQPE